jgi:hypothetical protein
MRTIATIWPAAAAALLLLASVPAGGASTSSTMKFGMDPGAVSFLTGQGARPDYAMMWAGAWNERSGWDAFATQADHLADRGVQPLVEWWYWGDSISVRCVQDGCWDDLHDVWLDRDHWRADAIRLADKLHAGLAGRPGVVVVESEFNKNGIESWETFDALLRDHAVLFRQHAPEVKLVLGFGNWGRDHWSTFDRAADAMDMVGFQTMRAKTRDSSARYLGAIDAVKDATSRLRSTFGKPVLLHDLALSSYDSSTWSGYQERVVRELFERRAELQGAGLQGVVYRALKDNPNADPANYYGQAEKHWGLQKSDNGWKPAMDDWIAGVKAARG